MTNKKFNKNDIALIEATSIVGLDWVRSAYGDIHNLTIAPIDEAEHLNDIFRYTDYTMVDVIFMTQHYDYNNSDFIVLDEDGDKIYPLLHDTLLQRISNDILDVISYLLENSNSFDLSSSQVIQLDELLASICPIENDLDDDYWNDEIVEMVEIKE